MNEPKNTAQKNKKEKVGADGLTKKERRAQKVSEKTKLIKNEEACNVSEKPVLNDITPAETVQMNMPEMKPTSLAEKQEERNTQSLNNLKVSDTNVKQLSKKERRARKVAEKQPETGQAMKENVQDNLQPQENKSVKTSNTSIKIVTVEKVADSVDGKTKAQIKAERRELQEKQRLAKQATKEAKVAPSNETKTAAAAIVKKQVSPPKKQFVKKETCAQVQLFNHLCFKPLTEEQIVVSNIHPSFIKLGSQYASKTISGSNARCLALLKAIKDLIDDFVTPTNQELCRSLETYLQTCVLYLQKCRPFAVSMTNALRHFKVQLTLVKTDYADDKKKSLLQKAVDQYIDEEIATAGEAISLKVSKKIVNGDIILTYGCSSLIKKILIDARNGGKVFKVIVVDGRPLLEGREMLRKLVNAGIDCSYSLINAISFTMGQVTKVLLGAHSLLANGYVMARTGTAQTALIAQAYNKPVLVCCETYKFCERVQTDSFVYNEIGDPQKIVQIDTLEENSPLFNMANSNSLTPLNLMYDVTPPDLVTAVVTELGFLPCTSVPVILRIKPTE